MCNALADERTRLLWFGAVVALCAWGMLFAALTFFDLVPNNPMLLFF